MLLIGIGIWVAAAPGSVPGLTLPTSPGADRARARMMHMEPGMPMKARPMQPATQMQQTNQMQQTQTGPDMSMP